MIFGTIVAASLGRVIYQIALTVTGGDNGFVTMFLNLVPALTALISLALSHWIADLHFVIDSTFFLGSAVIAASLVLFSLKSWRAARFASRNVLKERVQPPSEGLDGFLDALAPSVKKSPLTLRQKIFGPPAPLVPVLAQGLMILLEVGKQDLQGLEFGLDKAHAREERGLWLKLARCRCVRHGGIMAPKGYRSAKFHDRARRPRSARD